MAGFVINRVTMSGNLTRDPELRALADGTSVCSLRIASNDRAKDPNSGEWTDRPQYFNVTIWRGVGEHIARTCKKGDQIVVEGRLKWREWEQDGSRREAVDIQADNIVTAPRDRQSQQQSDAPADTQGLPAAQSASRPAEDSDEIPF